MVAVGVAPEGRGLLLKNHSIGGVGESDCVTTSAEHSREKLVSAVPVEPPEGEMVTCLFYTSPSPRDATLSRMPSSA